MLFQCSAKAQTALSITAFFIALMVTAVAGPLPTAKPPLDASACENWPYVDWVSKLSDDGKFVCYTISGLPGGGGSLVIQATSSPWRHELPASDSGVNSCSFTADSRLAVISQGSGVLEIVGLGGDGEERIADVDAFKLPEEGSGEWLAYRSKSGQLFVRNLVTGRTTVLDKVKDFLFSDDGKALALTTETMEAGQPSESLLWITPADGSQMAIWNGKGVRSIVFDKSGSRLAFVATDATVEGTPAALWTYKLGSKRAEKLTDDKNWSLGGSFGLNSLWGFTQDGESLVFTMGERRPPKPNSPGVQVDVWSYKDSTLQAQQLAALAAKKASTYKAIYKSAIRVKDGCIFRLESEGEMLNWPDWANDLVVVRQKNRGVCLASIKTGARRQISNSSGVIARLAPDDRFLVYCEAGAKKLCSYETSSGTVRDITQGITGAADNSVRGVVGWLPGDEAVLIYDQHDIWRVDPTNRRSPVNVTNRYGALHDTVFDLALPDLTHFNSYIDSKRLILSAFNLSTKENGFFAKNLDEPGDPENLSRGNWFFEAQSVLVGGPNFVPLGTVHSPGYVVRRMSATVAPNYFYTKDFRAFAPLSDVHPEQSYNWLTTEMITWQRPGGGIGHGVLYKPENFDPKKKYPLIMYCYEKMTDNLNLYTKPESSDGTLNIPYYVSNGYLVCCPDIRTAVGEPGKSAYDEVIGAAGYLSALPFVDEKKMGLQGHSFGSFETNYIVTHTDRFAAACSASGFSDLVSLYGTLMGGDFSNANSSADYVESGQLHMGGSLWNMSEKYIENSPVFRCDRVQTPMLLMYNKQDGWNFPQGMELFLGLRRMGKKVWMLQYDDGGHTVSDKSSADFSIRMAQFFDHYLKNAPPPRWMTEGIPARVKGIDSGLDLDTSGREP